MSLRLKLTLALVITSFAAILVVGATARWFMLERFDEFVVDRAGEGFVQEVVLYHREHGSFEAAVEAESFFDFNRRMATRRQGPPGVREGSSGTADADGQPEPGPLGGPPQRPFEFGGAPPPFVVTDATGTVLVPLAGFEVGDQVPEDRLPEGVPIVDGGVSLGLAVPLERPALSEMEERYLSAMEDSWLFSLLLAGMLAVPLGLVFADRLARPIREVTTAMGQMRAGKIRQTVAVASQDEVGELAESFNAMSEQLAEAYEELHASRARIDAHAREMAELSRRDALTGLLNRRAFDERMDGLLALSRRHGHEMSVAMIDLDRFKVINDEFSHAVGDQVLVRAARILAEAVRESDVMARWGGEEFVVAFPETSKEDAVNLAERLRETFERSDWSDLVPGRTVTVSIGLARVNDSEELSTALERADKRLYRAKDEGRNVVKTDDRPGPLPHNVPLEEES